MTISRTLLLAFLAMVMLPVAFIASLSFVASRQALDDEIRTSLQQDAAALMQRIDTELFERVHDLWSWSQLEVMQDASVEDVDKRLAKLLAQVQKSYGRVYRKLLFVDKDGAVIAASSAADIGHPRPFSERKTVAIPLAGGVIQVARPVHLNVGDAVVMPISAVVNNRFTGQQLGTLFALLDWQEVRALLGRVEAGGSQSGGRFALLLDPANQILAASPAARRYGLTEGEILPAPPLPGHNTTREITGLGSDGQDFLAGFALSKGYQSFQGLGWHLMVAEPASLAFAPVWRLLRWMIGLLLLTALAAALVARHIARRFSRPIEQLAGFTRHYAADRRLAPPSACGALEIRELNHAFAAMIERLEHSRAQLVQAGKLAAVGEMAAMLAHEVRTPLGILSSSAQVLGEDRALSAEGREMVEFILAESKRLNSLVTTLLECGRPREPDFQYLDLGALVTEVVELLARKAEARRIGLHTRLPDAPAWLEADAEQCKQILMNLLMNAIQILPPKQRVTITLDEQDDHLLLRISDTGPGIDDSDLPQLFDPFFTRRDGGIGLGLAIVQHIVDRHGGSIVVSNNPQGGACFTIRLPLQHEAPLT